MLIRQGSVCGPDDGPCLGWVYGPGGFAGLLLMVSSD
jgi:hypothetical protein